MHFMRAGQNLASVRALFAMDMPTGVRCWAILNGTAVGRVLVDDHVPPTTALVQELADGTVYIGGCMTAAALVEAIQMLRQEHAVAVSLWPNDPHLALLPPHPTYDGGTLAFTNRSAQFDVQHLRPLPVGCRLEAIDSDLFLRVPGAAWYVALFGNAEQALRHTQGYCLMRDDTFLCAALAGPSANGHIEIGVETPAPFRRQGYGVLTCTHLIRACGTQGYHTVWHTTALNTASIGLARTLGYQTVHSFRVLMW